MSVEDSRIGTWRRDNEAIADFTKVIQKAPNDAETYRRRAYAYAKLGQNDKAATDLKAVLKLQPGDADAQKQLKLVEPKQAPIATPSPVRR